MAGGHTDALELLLDFKASVATADGRTPLVWIAAALEGEKQASRAPLLRSLIGGRAGISYRELSSRKGGCATRCFQS